MNNFFLPSSPAISGSVDTWAELPIPVSDYGGQWWRVREDSGGRWPPLVGEYRYPAAIYEPDPTETFWKQAPIKVDIAEDTSTVLNIIEWVDWLNWKKTIRTGDRVIYENIPYKNITGAATTTPPDMDTINWDNAFPQGTIYVAKKGGHFTSVRDACLSIAAMIPAPAIDNTFYISVEPGCYEEMPFTIPAHTTLYLNNARLVPLDLNSSFIELSQNSAFRNGGVLRGPDVGYSVYTNGATGCICSNIRLNNEGGVGFFATGAGFITLLNCVVSSVDTAYWANGGAILANGISVSFAEYGLRVSNGGQIQGIGYGSVGGVNFDIKQDDAFSSIRFVGMLTSVDRIQAVNYNLIKTAISSDKEDDEAYVLTQGFSLGLPELGQEAVMGEGDSYTRGMLVYTETELGVFVDVSEAAQSASGSTVTYPGIIADNSIYLASSLSSMANVLQHFGIKTKMELAAVIGSGEIVFEYYNGSIWTEENGMEVDAEDQYFPHAKNYFQDTGPHHVRYNSDLAIDTWTKNDPMSLGTDYYWARFRIKTAITTAPIFQQFKLHTNRFEVNKDGWNEYFGKARPIGQLPFSIGQDRAFEGNLGNQTLYINEDLGAGLRENNFNLNTDKIGRFFFAPQDMDTSSPIRLKLVGRPSGTGTVEFTIRTGCGTAGSTIYTADPGILPGLNTVVQSKSVTAGIAEVFTFDIDVSNVIARREGGEPDYIGLSIHSSVLTGSNFALMAIEAEYTKWCEGGHI